MPGMPMLKSLMFMPQPTAGLANKGLEHCRYWQTIFAEKSSFPKGTQQTPVLSDCGPAEHQAGSLQAPKPAGPSLSSHERGWPGHGLFIVNRDAAGLEIVAGLYSR